MLGISKMKKYRASDAEIIVVAHLKSEWVTTWRWKREERLAACTPVHSEKVGTGKDEHKLQPWDGTEQNTTTPTPVSAVISPQYCHEVGKDVGITKQERECRGSGSRLWKGFTLLRTRKKGHDEILAPKKQLISTMKTQTKAV